MEKLAENMWNMVIFRIPREKRRVFLKCPFLTSLEFLPSNLLYTYIVIYIGIVGNQGKGHCNHHLHTPKHTSKAVRA
jgi:hypothetical protein